MTTLRGLTPFLLAGLLASARDSTPASAVPVVAPIAPAGQTPPPWRVWWRRNQALLAASPTRVVRLKPQAAPEPDAWLAAADEFSPNAFDAPHGALGAEAILDLIASPGLRGSAAVLALGARREPTAPAFLESLLLDDCVGRRLAGERPVSNSKRCAAALALGLSGERTAFGALRALLADGVARDDDIEAAALLALGLSGDEADGRVCSEFLRSGRGGPSAREAAAVGMARLAGSDRAAAAALAGMLAAEPRGAGRGAAAAARFVAPVAGDALGPALRAGAASADGVVRVMSLLSLAERGDAAMLDAVEREPDAGYALLALGLWSRRGPEAREAALREIGRRRIENPEAAECAVGIALSKRPSGRRAATPGPEQLAGGNGCFVADGVLGPLLDLLSRVPR